MSALDPSARPVKEAERKVELEAQKLELEIAQLKAESSKFGILFKRFGTAITVVTGFIAVFSGINQYANSINERRAVRLNSERAMIDQSFALLTSKDTNETAQGAVQLIAYADMPAYKDTVYRGLQIRLSVLPPPERRLDPISLPELKRFEGAQIRALVPLIEQFPKSLQQKLYLTIVDNYSLSYGRLVALEHLDDAKETWRRILADTDEYLAVEAEYDLERLRLPFARELLEELAQKDRDKTVRANAAKTILARTKF